MAYPDLHRRQLKVRGYTVLRRAFSPADFQMLDDYWCQFSRHTSVGHFNEFASLGRVAKVEFSRDLFEAVTTGVVYSTVASLLGPGLRFHGSRVFSKPAGSPQTYWHNDFIGWSEPCGYEARPLHLNALVYFRAVSAENGALRVIPCSHRKHHTLHTRWHREAERHEGQAGAVHHRLRDHDEASGWAYQDYPEQVTLETEPGDLVLVDSRLLHSTHINACRWGSKRDLLSVSYFADFGAFSDPFRALVSRSVETYRNAHTQSLWDGAMAHMAIDPKATGSQDYDLRVLPDPEQLA